MVVIHTEQLAFVIRQGLISLPQSLQPKIAVGFFKGRIGVCIRKQIRNRSNVHTYIIQVPLVTSFLRSFPAPILLQEFCDFVGYGYLMTIVVDVFHPAVLSFIQRRTADVGRNRESLCRFRRLGAQRNA